MNYLQRKIRVKYVGPKKYEPKTMILNKFVPVVGFDNRKRMERMEKEGQDVRWVDDLYYLVIGADGRILSVAAINCVAMIDQSEGILHEQMEKILKNLIFIGKILHEKMAKESDRDDSGNCEKTS